jgi:hypothetical protein
VDLSSSNQAAAAYFTQYPNQWAKIRLAYMLPYHLLVLTPIPREAIREPAAEMFGTMIFILVGTGVNCQFALSADANISPSPKGSYLGLNLAWGCGLW